MSNIIIFVVARKRFKTSPLETLSFPALPQVIIKLSMPLTTFSMNINLIFHRVHLLVSLWANYYYSILIINLETKTEKKKKKKESITVKTFYSSVH